MNKPPLDTTGELIEVLAEIEHAQWMHWSQAVAANVSAATRRKWQRSWVNYADLTEELKEADRVWARKVVSLLRQHKLVNL
jgi:hypothetical protein